MSGVALAATPAGFVAAWVEQSLDSSGFLPTAPPAPERIDECGTEITLICRR